MTSKKGAQKNIVLDQKEAREIQSIIELERQNVETDRVSRQIRQKSEYEKHLGRLSEKLAV